MDIYNLCGMRIKLLRKLKGIKQIDLAKVVGTNDRTIGNWEVGLAEPSMVKVSLMADYFGVSPDYFYGLDGKTLYAFQTAKEFLFPGSGKSQKKLQKGEPFYMVYAEGMSPEFLHDVFQLTPEERLGPKERMPESYSKDIEEVDAVIDKHIIKPD